MKQIIKIIEVVVGLIVIGAVIAGVVDRVQRKHDSHKPYGIYEKYIKRPLDFFLSAVALIVLSPVLLITAVLVRIKLGSPVIFTQERPGMIDSKTGQERIFKLHKFRTMTDERDKSGEFRPDSERLTPFGLWLRRISVDEIPEFINILKGDMSLVGPRPLLVRYLPAYTKEERQRHNVRPGLTGLAQVSGRNYCPWDERLSCDVEYVKKITFARDLKIVVKTVVKVLRHEDIAANTDEIDEGYLDEIRGVNK